LSAHTKGPWRDSNGSIIPELSTPGVFTLIADVKMRPHAKAPSSEGDANARLIAAAPEMLKALEDVCLSVSYALEENPDANREEILKIIFKQALAPIAKVEGRS